MSNDIKAGDLVIVVGCCCNPVALGKVFTVKKIADWPARCASCRSEPDGLIAVPVDFHGYVYQLNHLRKIDPPADMLEEEREKELTV